MRSWLMALLIVGVALAFFGDYMLLHTWNLALNSLRVQ